MSSFLLCGVKVIFTRLGSVLRIINFLKGSLEVRIPRKSWRASKEPKIVFVFLVFQFFYWRSNLHQNTFYWSVLVQTSSGQGYLDFTKSRPQDFPFCNFFITLCPRLCFKENLSFSIFSGEKMKKSLNSNKENKEGSIWIRGLAGISSSLKARASLTRVKIYHVK